jgi:hypothetical protein
MSKMINLSKELLGLSIHDRSVCYNYPMPQTGEGI